MTMWLKQTVFFFLLILSMASSFGAPRAALQESDFRVRNVGLERDEARADQQLSQQGGASGSRTFGLPDTGGYGARIEGPSNISDSPRRQGRMTPEERRALRRQIDEVGHDIYLPRH